MSISTKIQWCDSTVNPTMGCDGCELWNPKTGIKTCYAGILHGRHGGTNPGYSPTFERVTLFPGRMAKAANYSDLRGLKRPGEPWLDGYPRMIFVSDMSDALSKNVSFDFLKTEIIDHVDSPSGRKHIWLWLTKRPSRMAEFSRWLGELGIGWPSNVWPGTSVTSTQTTSRINDLLKVGDASTKRFLSVEPQWDEISLEKWLDRIDWVIQGGESGTKAKPFNIGWARRLRDECAVPGAAYFLKQLGENPSDGTRRIKLVDRHGGDWNEWPADLRVRQFPPLTKISKRDRSKKVRRGSSRKAALA